MTSPRPGIVHDLLREHHPTLRPPRGGSGDPAQSPSNTDRLIKPPVRNTASSQIGWKELCVDLRSRTYSVYIEYIGGIRRKIWDLGKVSSLILLMDYVKQVTALWHKKLQGNKVTKTSVHKWDVMRYRVIARYTVNKLQGKKVHKWKFLRYVERFINEKVYSKQMTVSRQSRRRRSSTFMSSTKFTDLSDVVLLKIVGYLQPHERMVLKKLVISRVMVCSRSC